MEIHKGQLTDIISLGPVEQVPESLVKSDNSVYTIEQNGILFGLHNNPLHSTLLEISLKDKKKFFTENFGKDACSYESNMIYLLRNDWDKYKFPVDQFRYVMRYFREVFKKHKVESAVVLMLNIEKKDWKVLFVLQCDSSHSSVNYLLPVEKIEDINDNKKKSLYEDVFKDKDASALMSASLADYQSLLKNGYVPYGTIHSHCDFSAFHSGVDDADEESFDGLHITIGNVDDKFSYSARYMIRKVAYDIKIEDVLGIEDTDILSKNIDGIKIDSYHMNLMMPDLGSVVTNLSQYSGREVRSFYEGRGYNIGDNDFESWHGPDYQAINQEHNRDSEISKFIWESSAVRLFDVVSGGCIWINTHHLNNNSAKYPSTRFIRLPDPDVPQECMDKHNKFMEKEDRENLWTPQEEQEEDIDMISLLNMPEINPNHPSGAAILESHSITDIDSFLKYHRKASKK